MGMYPPGYFKVTAGAVVKNLPSNTGGTRDAGSIPRLGRAPGIGNGNPLQYSRLGNPMDRGAWQAMVHGVAESQTRLCDYKHHHHHHHHQEMKTHTVPDALLGGIQNKLG